MKYLPMKESNINYSSIPTSKINQEMIYDVIRSSRHPYIDSVIVDYPGRVGEACKNFDNIKKYADELKEWAASHPSENPDIPVKMECMIDGKKMILTHLKKRYASVEGNINTVDKEVMLY